MKSERRRRRARRAMSYTSVSTSKTLPAGYTEDGHADAVTFTIPGTN
jgi:hypothetical protein